MIVSRTPLRISLVGGGTDVPEFFEKHPGCVVSMAINKYVYIMVNNKFDGRYRVSYSKTENVNHAHEIKHPLVRTVLSTIPDPLLNKGMEIVSVSDIPGEGSGLGSSSAFTVGLFNALVMFTKQKEFSPQAISYAAFITERKVNPNIGMQDHLAAAFGGFNRLDFAKAGDVIRTPLELGMETWDHMQEFFLLLWTGITRKSDDILRAQKEAFDSGKTIELGQELAGQARLMFDQLSKRQIQFAADTLHTAWHLKRRLAPGISNEWIDKHYQTAMNNGAWGGKLCGAGGGGFLFFMAPPDTHDRIVKATGLRNIDFNIDHEGSVIIKREGYGEF